MLHRLFHSLAVSPRRVFYKKKKKTPNVEKKIDNDIFWGWEYIFLCLPTYNSKFRHVEAKSLVPNTSNLQYYIVLSNSLGPERVRR